MKQATEIVSEGEERYEGLLKALRPPSDYNQHVYKECTVCGHVEWRSSSKQEKGEIVFDPMDMGWDDHCRQCAEVQARAPELARWVFNVLITHERRAHKETP